MKIRKLFMLLGLLLLPALFNSCQHPLGYSVLLWDLPEHNLQDGQLVKVYFKSNISHTYIAGIPKSRERFEIPLWQISKPTSKKKALKAFEAYNEYLHKYGKIKVDGLPVRKEPVNTSKQVYRLHKDEIVKILYKGDGQDVMVGKNKKLPGDWLCVLTEGGSRGWCFSYNLSIFETDATGAIVSGEVEETQATNEDTLLNQILEAKWYPDYYARLLKDNMIDLETIKLNYGFDTGISSGKIQVNIPGKYHSASYAGAEKIRDNTYSLIGTLFQIMVRNKDTIVVNYAARDGSQEAYTFITLDSDINLDEIIENEKERRNNLMNELYKVVSFNSQNYGQLVFNSGKTFTWSGYSLLVPSVIPSSAKGRGTVSMKYLPGANLKSKYDGVLTFKFEGIQDEINFLYKLSNDGLNLESLDSNSIKDNIAVSRDTNPIVMFFNK
ncbi:MAG: SH3 domain-containing protein [Treponema sp.]|uniref:SH3 domain-containing protein n=1 Tax=Treponema sp. TaxID=166 RepID=UPI00298E3D3E|nr:SH3 domain-containing protein [Treponema sp.]MCR5385873.1 SH3 domain-containing protein [Treponema sp.]